MEKPSEGVQLLDFHADRPLPTGISGAGISRTADGALLVSAEAPDGVSFSFPASGTGHVSAMVSAQSLEPGRFELILRDGAGKRLLFSGYGLRNRGVGLPSFSPGATTVALVIRSLDRKPFVVRELSIRRSPVVRYPPVHLILFGVAILLLVASTIKRELDTPVLGLLVGLIALGMRWATLSGWAAQPLQGDAIFYADIAGAFSPARLFDTGMREPLHVWLQVAAQGIGGGPFATRALSAFLSSVIAAMLVPLGVRLFGSRVAGVAAGGLFAVGDFYVWNATRGERTETYLILLILFLLLLLKFRTDGRRRLDLMLGGIAALVSLTWLIGVVATGLAYVARWKALPRRGVRALLFVFPIILALLPHFLAQKRINGDPFFALNAHTSFYRSAEETGTPRYDGRGGGLAQFLLEKPAGRFVGLCGGYFSLFLNPNAPFNRIFLGFHYEDARALLLYPFLLVGIAAVALRRRWMFFWFLFSVVSVSPAMIAQVRDPRLFLFAGAFVSLFWGAGVAACYESARGLYSRTSFHGKRRRGPGA